GAPCTITTDVGGRMARSFTLTTAHLCYLQPPFPRQIIFPSSPHRNHGKSCRDIVGPIKDNSLLRADLPPAQLRTPHGYFTFTPRIAASRRRHLRGGTARRLGPSARRAQSRSRRRLDFGKDDRGRSTRGNIDAGGHAMRL